MVQFDEPHDLLDPIRLFELLFELYELGGVGLPEASLRFVDFIFASELDQDPQLRADMEAAGKRMEGHVLDRLGKKASARQRLGRLEGVYSFSALVSSLGESFEK